MEGSHDLRPLIKLLTVNLSQFTFSLCLEEKTYNRFQDREEEILKEERPKENRGHGTDEERRKGVGRGNKNLGQNIGFIQPERTNELEECFLT